MLRLTFAAVFIAAASAQTGGGGQNGTQCGGTTGLPCPSNTALPCCTDPARCQTGQQLCPTPSYTPMSTKLPCCVDQARCTAGQQLCPSPSPSNYTQCCPAGVNCTGNITACSPYPTRPPYNGTQCCATADCLDYPPCPPINTTQCCTTIDCYNKTGLPPCPSSVPTNYPSPSVRPSVAGSPSASNSVKPSTPSADSTVRPSNDPTKSIDATVRPSVDPSKDPQPSQDAEPSSDPQPSAEPTQRPAPVSSTDPTKRPAPSDLPTVKPTERAPAPSTDPTRRPTPSPLPTRNGPSAPPTIRPTRRPAATLFVQAPIVSVRPSRWPQRPSASPLANIGVLTGAFTFNNVNTSVFTDPVKLQQVTTNIACAARVPFENIVIQNITRAGPDGIKTRVPYDASLTTLNSNGTVVCYNISGQPRQLRVRRLLGDSSVSIEYSIVDPPTEILAADPDTYSSIMESEPAISNLAFVLGSDGVYAEAPPELALAAYQTTGSESPNSPQDSKEIVPYVVVGVVVAFVIGGVVVGSVMMFMSRKQKPAMLQKTSPALVIYTNAQTTNPLVSATTGQQQPQRTAFDPVQQRTANRV